MTTTNRPSSATLMRAFRVPLAVAADMLWDTSGSTYTREVNGSEVHYDTTTRTLTLTPLEV